MDILHVCIRYSYCPVPQSVCACFQCPEYPARGQQLKFMVSWVCAVFQDASCPLKTTSVIDVLQGWERVAEGFVFGAVLMTLWGSFLRAMEP